MMLPSPRASLLPPAELQGGSFQASACAQSAAANGFHQSVERESSPSATVIPTLIPSGPFRSCTALPYFRATTSELASFCSPFCAQANEIHGCVVLISSLIFRCSYVAVPRVSFSCLGLR